MIDVFNEIKDLINIENDDDFLYLQILQRKKENPELGSNSRVIKNYYINNLEYLEKKYDEIKKLCVVFNARAMLRLNKRSYRKVAFKAMQNIANSMGNGEYTFVNKSYDRACGQGHNDKQKKWIIDIDDSKDKKITEKDIENISLEINKLEPLGDKILKTLKTKNGFHLITTPFNLKNFRQDVSIHKDNPINLFIP